MNGLGWFVAGFLACCIAVAVAIAIVSTIAAAHADDVRGDR